MLFFDRKAPRELHKRLGQGAPVGRIAHQILVWTGAGLRAGCSQRAVTGKTGVRTVGRSTGWRTGPAEFEAGRYDFGGRITRLECHHAGCDHYESFKQDVFLTPNILGSSISD